MKTSSYCCRCAGRNAVRSRATSRSCHRQATHPEHCIHQLVERDQAQPVDDPASHRTIYMSRDVTTASGHGCRSTATVQTGASNSHRNGTSYSQPRIGMLCTSEPTHTWQSCCFVITLRPSAQAPRAMGTSRKTSDSQSPSWLALRLCAPFCSTLFYKVLYRGMAAV